MEGHPGIPTGYMETGSTCFTVQASNVALKTSASIPPGAPIATIRVSIWSPSQISPGHKSERQPTTCRTAHCPGTSGALTTPLQRNPVMMLGTSPLDGGV